MAWDNGELIGKTFDSWTVLSRAPSNGKTYYYCRCVCGKECAVRRSALLDGTSLSCGCRGKDMRYNRHVTGADVALVGQTFGFLTVLEIAETPSSYRKVCFRCRCVCGKEGVYPKSNLLRGNSKSCGCHGKVDNHNDDDLTGRTFGYWTALEKIGPRNGTYYRCRCVCGTEHNVQKAMLLRGTSKSCGCKRYVRFEKKKEKGNKTDKGAVKRPIEN